MFGRKKKAAKSESDVVRHDKDYPIMAVNIDEMNADNELFHNWIHSAGITSITIRSPFDPYERGDMGLLARQGDDISHKSYNMMSDKITAELSNIMFRIIGSRYRTSILIDNGYWGSSSPDPSFRINHDEYIYLSMAKVRHGDGDYLYWLCQCDDAPGNDALDDIERMELGKAITWFIEASTEERKTYADIITWVGPDVDPVPFLTGDGMNAAPARLINRADVLIEHMEHARDSMSSTMPDDIMGMVDACMNTAHTAASALRTRSLADVDWNDQMDIIDTSATNLDALVFAASTMTMANESRHLRLALVDTIRDIELMNSEHEQRGRAVIDSALTTGREREHVR
jgi:hypothetical protein